jgi:hypothetical protein
MFIVAYLRVAVVFVLNDELSGFLSHVDCLRDGLIKPLSHPIEVDVNLLHVILVLLYRVLQVVDPSLPTIHFVFKDRVLVLHLLHKSILSILQAVEIVRVLLNFGHSKFKLLDSSGNVVEVFQDVF